ncbi:MAG: 23S rRNA (adenine(2503)-C(2))-methyltransferase RlmN [Fuerstiella sp.]
MTKFTSIFDSTAVERLRRSLRLDPQLVRVLRNRLLKKFEADDAGLEGFPGRDQLQLHVLEQFRRVDSSIDGATKLLLKTATGMLIEAVILRIASGRTTLCVSSQVGCAAACDFCATGKMGVAQNLSSAQILDQVLQVGQLLAGEQRRLDNIVFMGMGEPFHNEENLYEALTALTAPQMFARSPNSLLVSTVGIPDAMLRCAERFPNVNLALSLHSVDAETRLKLIPLTQRHSLDELQRVIREINGLQRRELMIEYLMLAGENDSADDANDLIQWLDGLNVHVNLIPYNPIEDAPHLRGSDRETIEGFAAQLKASGSKTTIRYSLGNDIAAACGQLVRKENRQRFSPR